MEAWNRALFNLLNASPTASHATIAFARLAATYPPYLLVVLISALWIWGPIEKRHTIVTSAFSLFVGLMANSIIRSVWHHPRPDEAGVGQIFMAHALNSSFPSDHATFIWSLGLSLLAARAWTPLALAIIGLGVLTAWARVYLGVHFPIDMFGAVGVSAAAATIGLLLRPAIAHYLQRPIEQAYESALSFLHLPAGLFPRKTSSTANMDTDRRR